MVPQEYIVVRGARENNLRNVSLSIPKRKITIFTGVSGSGKSSIVFDTIASEGQRLLNENFTLFVQTFLPRAPQPDADAIENLSMPVIVDQRRLGGGSRSTVGTTTDIATLLRVMFSRLGQPHVGGTNAFSFNDPQGMCPECNGLGRKLVPNMDLFLDMSKSLNGGALLFPDYGVDKWDWTLYTQSGFFDNDKPLADYTAEELHLLLEGDDLKVRTEFGGKAINLSYEGAALRFRRKFILRDLKTLSERVRKTVEPFLIEGVCPLCYGARLSQAALNCRVHGHGIADLSAMEISALLEVVRTIRISEASPLVARLEERLQHVVDIGLGYLTLNRETDTLSGGESQRVKIVKFLSGSLVDVMYIFDEPSIGLHPRDVHRLNALLQTLRDKGNTVIVVEHDPDVIQEADHIVDVGPRAGRDGGQVVYQGSYEGLLASDTLTGRTLMQQRPLKDEVRTPTGWLPIRNARANNLQNVSVDVPTGVLTVVTGVAGSGKSTLIHQVFLAQHTAAIVIDQFEVAGNTRSNPATYTGIMDDIRKAFASANGVSASLFSFNSDGACDNCQGLGVVYTDLAALGQIKAPCEVCDGKRFKDEVLTYTLEGHNISDVLGMTVRQALDALVIKKIIPRLRAMSDVGLDYLTLGQPLSTLSGGECQRIKLASELHRQGNLYVMDEPTTGLHKSDIGRLLAILDRLADGGNTVVVIEHNLDVIRHADWIIDLGPEGGSKGGQVLYAGPPQALLGMEHSLTSAYL